MNSELCRQALAKVRNPNILVNLVSRRVRQLNAGSGGSSRPLIDATGLGVADIALTEILEDKITFEEPEGLPVDETTARKQRKKG